MSLVYTGTTLSVTGYNYINPKKEFYLNSLQVFKISLSFLYSKPLVLVS